ncbi:BTAD domain-containing putative transcriptional regulator [Streptomyces sp. NBC_01408]|uniref:AfsR/SARP family transcriptional regulator n=1 Tax=Streptomyces sp. NBC_01408 TaxID=2903855 RepID=UPI00224CFD8A|nr:BTAD domain-containing putative transcriptional regulator [Streptomyces sp. NBC_01408]MCX4696185.1 NB-ARC domain-containing protein [Streptomyces sp. NBC_01408]
MDSEPPEQLRIAVLGPLRACRGGAPLDLGPVKRQAVLAALLLSRGAVVSHEQLMHGVWGSEPPASGHRVLASHVNPLRRALDADGTRHTESVIRSGKGWYRFAVDGVRLDVADLTERGVEARRTKASGELARAVDQLSSALALFRGEPLAGLPGLFAQAERERLSERRRGLRLDRLECLVLLGRFGDALDDLTILSPSDRYDESLLALRMRALYGCERQAEALNAYQGMRVRLRDELGVDPGEELHRLYEAVLRRDDEHLLGPAAARSAAQPARPRTRRTVNELPGDAGRLVGREAELAQLTEAYAPGSLSIVTVDGTAGVGKTALVVRAARELSDQYPDGSLFVDLRAHSTQRRHTPEQALQRLLRSLGAAKGELPSDLEELTAAWRAATSPLRLLLVLDDVQDADQVRPLLPAGAGSRVLVAGRRRLPELDADRRVTLEPLRSGGAVLLITHIIGEERASREPEATRRLAGLCDGLPLALRIAGSRLQDRRTWTVEYLVGRMAGDERRLGELSIGDRSVEAAFRLSYDQLAPDQQFGFRALGQAPTVEFDVLAPAAMLGRPPHDTERILESLVDANLLQQPRPGRYRLHDLVRVHARRLAEALPDEAAGTRTAALRLYLDAARIASDWGLPTGFPTGPQPSGAPFATWKDAEIWLDAAGGELVDVVGQAVVLGEVDYACWIAEALVDYFTRQGRYHESQTALEIALAHVDEATDPRMALALRNCLAYTGVYQRRYTQSRTVFTEALHLSRRGLDSIEETRALIGLASVDVSVGEADQAISRVAEALAVYRAPHNDWIASIGFVIKGLAHQLEGRNEEALAGFAEARTHADRGRRPRMLGRVLSFAAEIHLRRGRYAEAKSLLRQAVHLVGEAGDVFLCACSLTRLGTAEQGVGDPGAAVALHHQALIQHQLLSPLTEPAYDWLEMDIRSRLGRAYLATGRIHEALGQFQAVLELPDRRPGAL